MRVIWLLPLLVCACVERRLQVRTDPPGAFVSVNGKRIGRSPVSWRFDHYGKVLVEADLDGHEPARQVVHLKRPAREWIVGGFFTDVVWPGTIHDDHSVELKLSPERKPSDAEVERELTDLAGRAVRLRNESERP